MDQREVEALVVKISMFANRVTELGEHVAQQSRQATQQLTQTAQGLGHVADQSVARIVDGVEKTAAKSISAGAIPLSPKYSNALATACSSSTCK